jgi:molecular chaperone GrpE (heat shock protein)
MPEDGFCALLYQRDLNSTFVQDHIGDIILRMMRDRRRRSITLDEIRRELSPIVAMDKKGWDPWWSTARKRLLAGQNIALDPKKKGVFCATDSAPAAPSEDLASQVRGARTPQAVLAAAKSLDLAPDQDRSENAQSIAERVLAAFSSTRSQDRAFLEQLCCLSYVLPHVEKTAADKIIALVDSRGFEGLHVPADLEEELSVALSRLGRCTTFPDLALALLKHPSPKLQGRAFTALNTEKHRLALKAALLDWISNPDDRTMPKPSLYLRDDFLQYLRSTDILLIFRRIVERPATADIPAIRGFLEVAAPKIFSSAGANERLRLLILGTRLLSDDAKRDLVLKHPAVEDLILLLIDNFEPDLKKPLIWAISQLRVCVPLRVWSPVLGILRSSAASDLFQAVAKQGCDRLDAASGGEALTASSQICDLLSIAEEHHPDYRRILESALERFGRRLSAPGTATSPEPLVRGIRAVVEASQREARNEGDRLANVNDALTSQLATAAKEVQRLAELVETLKSSASFDRYELEANSRIEAVRPFLLLLDDLYRQAGPTDTSLRSVIASIEAALRRGGFEGIGASGGTVAFDPSVHEFAEEPGHVPPEATVRVVRPGYTLTVSTSKRVVRRALVRPTW